MGVLNCKRYGYTKIDIEDPEEVKHRKAQFLIYKGMQKADGRKRQASWLRVKMFKLKIKIGKRLINFRKALHFSAKPHLCKQISFLLKSCKHLLLAKQEPIIRTIPHI